MTSSHQITIVTDLGFGDAGKGSAIDYLARSESASTVVRFNGGPQAGHNVVTPEGKHHTFHQFGSASFVDGVKTHLSRSMLVSPFHLWAEAHELAGKGVADPIGRITIDQAALIITPYHEAANRIREALRGADRHGSCGYGVGETMQDSLEHPDDAVRARDLLSPATLRRKLEATRGRKLAEFSACRDDIVAAGRQLDIECLEDNRLSQTVIDFYKVFADSVPIVDGDYLGQLIDSSSHLLFEGAQGVLLDEWYGFHPYTTWSTTTNAKADQLIDEAGYGGSVRKLGLLRAYATRHGAGPFPTECPVLTERLTDRNNPHNPWQEGFRVGYFDQVLLRYALDVVGQIDGLVISCLDQLIGLKDWSVCSSYQNDSAATDHLTPVAEPDLDYQAGLTAELFKYQPVLQQIVDGPFEQRHLPDCLAAIESMLGLPIHLSSTGPTANDKRLHI